MDNNTTKPAVITETAAVTTTPAAPAPQVEGVKIHPTSFLAAKTEIVPPKKMLAELQEWHIETVHIIIFFVLIICLFIGMWKRPNLR